MNTLHENRMRAAPSAALSGAVTAPGDKSISHRALILGALAEGETRISGLLEGDDVLRTAAAMRALGAEIERDSDNWRVVGRAWRSPEKALYFGNAGTGSRLTMGAVAGRRVDASFDGDASLRARPMSRIIDPLAQMGLKAESRDGRLPCRFYASALKGIDYTLPKPSAQIKSAILLAGLSADGETIVREPTESRDHTERMLSAFGVKISTQQEAEGRVISLIGGQRLSATDIAVPGDPSSAAFLIAAATLVEGSDLTIRQVLLNPHRIGFLETLREMGAKLTVSNERLLGGEPVGDIRVQSARLKGVAIPASRAPAQIDEYPILSVLAAFAGGDTYMPGISELRVKESDRIATMEAGLQACGVKTDSGGDWMRIYGRGGDVEGGGEIDAHHDHRIAMSFLILGLAAQKPIATDGADMIATSFPNFEAMLSSVGAQIQSL